MNPSTDLRRRARIGLLGCGRIAQRFHLRILARLPGATLTAVAEPDPAQRGACESTARGAVWFEHYEALLDAGAIDAAVICLPPALHAEAAAACFERGLHVYLEKPLAASLEEGRQIVAAWRKAGTSGVIGFNQRLNPLATAMRSALAAGRLGEPVGGQGTFCAAVRALPEWKRRRDGGGGVLLDLACHQFDLARFVMDRDIIEVSAALRSIASEEDTAVVETRLEGGPLMTFFLTLAGTEEDRMEVTGTRGKLVLDRYRSSRLRFVAPRRDFSAAGRLRAAGDAPRAVRDALFPPRERGFARALAGFAASVRGEAVSLPDLDDGLKALAVVAAAEHAARTGSRTAVAEVRGEGAALGAAGGTAS